MRADRHLQNRLRKFLFDPSHVFAIVGKPYPKIKGGIRLIAIFKCFLLGFIRMIEKRSNDMIPTAVPIRLVDLDLAGHTKYFTRPLRVDAKVA